MQCLEYHGTPPNHLVFVAGVECVGVFGFLMFLSVVFAMGSRPVPFRTRKLSLSAPMVLHSGGCGRVGRRRHHNLKSRICTEVNTPSHQTVTKGVFTSLFGLSLCLCLRVCGLGYES